MADSRCSPVDVQLVERFAFPVALFRQTGDESSSLICANHHFLELLDVSLPALTAQALHLCELFGGEEAARGERLMAERQLPPRPVAVAPLLPVLKTGGCWMLLPLSSDTARPVSFLLAGWPDASPGTSSDMARQQRLQQLVDVSHDGILIVDQQQRIDYANPAAARIFGYEPEALCGCPLERLIPDRFHRSHRHHIQAFLESDLRSKMMQERAVVTGRHRDGREVPLDVAISKLQVGNHLQVVAQIRDVSRRALEMERLRQAAFQDPLTQIYNRRHISSILNRELQRAIRFQRRFSLVMMDLDHFKRINDLYGHAIGDELLLSFVDHVKSVIRSVDVFGRWGGEEFILVLPETGVQDAGALIEHIRNALRARPGMPDPLYGITASFGVTEVRPDDTAIQSLIGRADQAMYAAKRAGRDRICTA